MRKVIGMGESVLDIVFRNDSPQAAVVGGSVLNAIVSLARSGVETWFLTGVGDDFVGQKIIRCLRENGVFTDHIAVHEGIKTPHSLAVLNANNEAQYSFYRDKKPCLPSKTVPTVCPNDVVIIGSYFAANDEMRPFVMPLLRHAREKGAIVVYDVNFREAHKDSLGQVKANILENISLANVVRGSRDDLRIVFGTDSPQAVFAGNEVFMGKTLLCTDGAKDIVLIDDRGATHTFAVPPIETVSTIGAGDNFNAGLVFGLLRLGITLQDLRQGIDIGTWNRLVDYAIAFSSACCRSLSNYVPESFGESLK